MNSKDGQTLLRFEKVNLPRSGYHFKGGFLSELKMTETMVYQILGTGGSLIVCLSSLPQIIKTYRTKKANDISIFYLVSLMIGLFMITGYSIFIDDHVFIFGNGLALFSTIFMIVLWFQYKKNP